MIKKYRLNINLPRFPKGTIIYYKYEILPSQYGVNKTYVSNEKWYTKEKFGECLVWDWVAGLVRTCDRMSNFDSAAKKMVTKIK